MQKANSRLRILEKILAYIFLLIFPFDPDYIVHPTYIAGFRINTLDFRIRFKTILGLLFILVFILRHKKELKRNIIRVDKKIKILLLILLALLLFSVVRAVTHTWVGLILFLDTITFWGTFFIIIYTLITDLNIKHVVIVTVLGGFEFVISILQVFWHGVYVNSVIHRGLIKLGESPLLSVKALDGYNYIFRAFGTTPHPNILGFWAVFYILVLLYAFRRLAGKQRKFLRIIALGLFFWSGIVFLSLSKSAILVLIVLLIVFGLSFNTKVFNKLATSSFYKILFIISALIQFFTPLVLLIFEKFTNIYFINMRNLVFKYVIALTSVKEWLLGIGYHNYYFWLVHNFARHKVLIFNNAILIEPIHNTLWLIALELGWITTLIIYYLGFVLFTGVFKRIKNENVRFLLLGLIVILLGLGMLDHYLYTIM